MSSQELSPADRSSLAAERGSINMAVGGLLVVDAEPPLTRKMIADRIGERIHLVPRLRQRLEEPPLGMMNPVWADDTGFDLDWHVRQASLPDPGGEQELGAFVGREFSHRLDRSRPLWEATLIEGLQHNRKALLFKVHHALVDGMAALGMAALVLDPSEQPLEIPPPATEWEPRKYDMRRHVAKLATKPLARAPRLMMEGMLRALDPDPSKAATDMRRTIELALELARQRPQAPMTPLNRPISPNRRYAIAHTDLATIKRVGKAAGGTVNDTMLAVVAGMLGRYLAAAGPEGYSVSDRSPVALVPVSVRAQGESGGNRISTVFVDLPIHEHDLVRRIQAITSQTSELKESAAVRAGTLMVGASGWAPPLVSGMLARAMGQVRAFNVVVSNVPGPQQPFFLDGVRMREVYPVVPLNPANQGLTIGILSYDGQVCFGLLADRDLDPPLSTAAAGLQAALGELQAAAAP
ncbi:MAG TPA: wax ester/triacylglycerol synthase family O-acyltransferase [Solirubrobacteraceae bacterium]|nr:wax ester/triacylglycerol synthase family O-acyltransferase [Solirubrobacteraceae bacterium]